MGSVGAACGLSCPATCGILVPWSGIGLSSPALGEVLTTGPPGKSHRHTLGYCRLTVHLKSRRCGFCNSAFLKQTYMYYLFGCAESYLQHEGSSIFMVTCRILSFGMRDLVPQPGPEPRPPQHWEHSLSHWTTREVPLLLFLKAILALLDSLPLYVSLRIGLSVSQKYPNWTFLEEPLCSLVWGGGLTIFSLTFRECFLFVYLFMLPLIFVRNVLLFSV